MDLFSLILCIFLESYILFHKHNILYLLLPLSYLLLHKTIFDRKKIYLLDYSCLSPHPKLRVPTSCLMEHIHFIKHFDAESIEFMSKIIAASGQGEETSLPPAMRFIPPKLSHHDFIEEAQLLLFPVLDDLLKKTGLSPSNIDVLVVTCSLFCPSPSLSSIVANYYKMRQDTKTFNISGTGCSGGAVAVDLASHLLRTSRRTSYAVILSTEVLSPAWYSGRDRSKLLINCTFRMGSCALMLTNKKHATSTYYELANMVRTNHAFDDAAYYVSQLEDDGKGFVGFTVKRDIMRVVREVITSNATSLGREILPLDEKLRYILWCMRNILLRKREHKDVFLPDFGRAVQHYCFPTISKGVVEEIGKGLGLTEKDMEAGLSTFHRFGNTSAASLWYQLGYIESKGRMKKGDKVWMIAFGSGCKCNSMVWECIKEVKGRGEGGPWEKCIDNYPLDT